MASRYGDDFTLVNSSSRGRSELTTNSSVALLARSSAALRGEGEVDDSAHSNPTHFANHVELYSYKLVAIKLTTASKEHLEKHYADLSDKPFFKGLVTCTSAMT